MAVLRSITSSNLLGSWSGRSAGLAPLRMRREGMAIDRPQIDGLGRAAGRTAHPQEPMPCLERAADRWREQHWHALGLPFIPRRDEAAGIFEDLGLGRALRGGCCALCLHLAAVKAHGADFAAARRGSSSGRAHSRDRRLPAKLPGGWPPRRPLSRSLGRTIACRGSFLLGDAVSPRSGGGAKQRAIMVWWCATLPVAGSVVRSLDKGQWSGYRLPRAPRLARPASSRGARRCW